MLTFIVRIVCIPKEQNDQYLIESMAGDPTDLMGSNVHFRQSGTYDDFGRRLLFFSDDGNRKNSISENDNLTPMKAPPELVMALAKLSATRQANTVVDPMEELAKRSIVRTGEYWDGVWKEDVETPTNNVLRSIDKSKTKPVPGIGIVKAKVAPGSKLYRLISVLQQFSPRLLYVVNKEQGK
ncbi:hypothetical protein RR46_01777 [Papilio xuthus]|uniref:Uncharacterized protein n=1 Tax=Papilio xuthus TaxID=66420 RepID=A0A194QHE3_PAPXU|nr:hypothetical protein RR46_01777 [Papilio xuthus]